MRHKKRLIERQMVVERLADMAAELYARAVTVSRTQRLIDTQGLDATTRELDLCDLFCVTSGRRFRELRIALQEGGETIDDRRRAIAAQLRADQGYGTTAALLDVPTPARTPPSLTPPAAPEVPELVETQ